MSASRIVSKSKFTSNGESNTPHWPYLVGSYDRDIPRLVHSCVDFASIFPNFSFIGKQPRQSYSPCPLPLVFMDRLKLLQTSSIKVYHRLQPIDRHRPSRSNTPVSLGSRVDLALQPSTISMCYPITKNLLI